MDGTMERSDGDLWRYRSTKNYDHNEGLSCCFRQWRATHSHCRLIHGYALAFRFTFLARELDSNQWCYDFGGLKPVREWLHEMFDHTLLVAEDDPMLEQLRAMHNEGLADVRVVKSVGCEAIARLAHEHVDALVFQKTNGRVLVETVEVSEHGGNSAMFTQVRIKSAAACDRNGGDLPIT